MTQIRRAGPEHEHAITALLERVAVADGREAITEFKAMSRARGEAFELVAVAAGAVVGYAIAACHGERAAVEIAVDPDAADDPSVALITEARGELPGGGQGVLWARRPGDRRAAARLGLERERALATMERSLDAPAEAVVVMPPGVTLRTFRVEEDEKAWLAANRSAFAQHPETREIDGDDLSARMAEPWFDPHGFLLAERDGFIVGYCWTKLHPDGVGEVYIIGVVPRARGEGLGQALLEAGMADLAGRQGAERVMLYMDGDDATLRSFYENRGFTRSAETLAFRLEAAESNRG